MTEQTQPVSEIIPVVAEQVTDPAPVPAVVKKAPVAKRKVLTVEEKRQQMIERWVDPAVLERIMEGLLRISQDPTVRSCDRIRASEILLDRVMGKVPQSKEVTGQSGGPIMVKMDVFR